MPLCLLWMQWVLIYGSNPAREPRLCQSGQAVPQKRDIRITDKSRKISAFRHPSYFFFFFFFLLSFFYFFGQPYVLTENSLTSLGHIPISLRSLSESMLTHIGKLVSRISHSVAAKGALFNSPNPLKDPPKNNSQNLFSWRLVQPPPCFLRFCNHFFTTPPLDQFAVTCNDRTIATIIASINPWLRNCVRLAASKKTTPAHANRFQGGTGGII